MILGWLRLFEWRMHFRNIWQVCRLFSRLLAEVLMLSSVKKWGTHSQCGLFDDFMLELSIRNKFVLTRRFRDHQILKVERLSKHMTLEFWWRRSTLFCHVNSHIMWYFSILCDLIILIARRSLFRLLLKWLLDMWQFYIWAKMRGHFRPSLRRSHLVLGVPWLSEVLTILVLKVSDWFERVCLLATAYLGLGISNFGFASKNSISFYWTIMHC